MLKGSGPKIEPCGTPSLTFDVLLKQSLICSVALDFELGKNYIHWFWGVSVVIELCN